MDDLVHTTPPPRGVCFMSGVNVNLDALITGTEAAHLAGVSKQLVYRWRTLGHLTPAQTNPPLYRVRDVLKAEQNTRLSPKSRRHIWRSS